jgi:hypothetical protein
MMPTPIKPETAEARVVSMWLSCAENDIEQR